MRIEKTGEAKVIISNPYSMHNYFAWPSVARLQNGKIAVVCSGFRLGHVCPFGKAVISYSEDEGQTYTYPAPVIDTILDDRDAGIAVVGEDTVIVTSFNLEWATLNAYRQYYRKFEGYVDAYAAQITQEMVRDTEASRFCISRDCGITFKETYCSPITSPHGPIALRDGTILWVGRTYTHWDTDPQEDGIFAYRVHLDGKMERLGQIDPIYEGEKRVTSCEPYAVELNDGTIICHIRVHSQHGMTTFQSESKDGGRVWSAPHRILEYDGNAPAHLLQHSSGTLISVYGHRNGDDSGIRVMLSNDNGNTWETDYELFKTQTGPDLGYPAVVELSDNSLLTVFYASEYKDGPAVIMQQKWRLAD